MAASPGHHRSVCLNSAAANGDGQRNKSQGEHAHAAANAAANTCSPYIISLPCYQFAYTLKSPVAQRLGSIHAPFTSIAIMDVEVANPSAFAGSPFNHEWSMTSDGQQGGLGPIAEYNASFETNNGGTVDPQLTLSNPSTPNNEYNAAYNGHFSGLDQTFSPAASAYDAYQPPIDGISPYYQSVEANPNPIYQPSPLRYNHRRSVSEPPGGPAMQPPPPPMVLHRDNHCLGHPMRSSAVPLKSMPKAGKQQRQHPYARKTRELHRPDVKRAHTQPVRAAPTSMPHPMAPPYMPQAIMQDSHLITSRVCTPTPQGGAMLPLNIDQALSGVPSPMHSPQMRSDPRKILLVPLAVDELRAMIFEAVQKAVGSHEAGKESTSGDGGEDLVEVKEIESEDVQSPGEIDL